MKETDDLEQLFDRLNGQFDDAEPAFGHEERFLDRLEKRHKKKRKWMPYAAAACLTIGLGSLFMQDHDPEKKMNYLSADSRQADSVFNADIDFGKEILLEKKSATNKMLVDDALNQLQAMEKDYNRLKTELHVNGESQQLMHALLLNLKTRIEFLEQATQQIEQNEKHQNIGHEQIL